MRFCRENLRHKSVQNWKVDQSSINTENKTQDVFKFNLTVNDSPEPQSKLSLIITALKSGGIRFRVSPIEKESYNRYDLSQNGNVINQTNLNNIYGFVIQKSDEKETILEVTDTSDANLDNKIEKKQPLFIHIEHSPLKIYIGTDKYKQINNGKIIEINGDEQFVFEHHSPNITVQKETFNRFTDIIPNGPTAVGADIKFFGKNVRLSGLSERASPINLADTDETDPLRLFNTDAFEYEADVPIGLYGSIPFVHAHSSSLSAAVFWMNPTDTFVDISTIKNNDDENDEKRKIRFLSEGSYLDFVVFVDDFKSIMKSYCELTSYPMFAPLFAIGYHQSRWGYSSQHEVSIVIRSLDDAHIPFDSIFMDIEHLSKRQPFTISRTGFPAPFQLFNYLFNNYRYVVRVCDPHFPHSNYDAHQQATESRQKHLLVMNDDTYFLGQSWPGVCVFPDFLNPATVKWYSQQFSFENDEYGAGNVFFWNDMNEPSITNSDQSTFPKSLIHFANNADTNNTEKGYENREIHNLYGLLNTVGTFTGLLNRYHDQNVRPFVLTRSFFAGSQQYAWTWTGDNTASWEHLKVSIPMILTSAICGMPFTGSDIGGFLKSPDYPLLLRWYQAGAWLYPFFREHCHHNTARREPFMYDDSEQDYLKEIIVDRYKIIPVWYTATYLTHKTGIPPVLPLWAVFPGNDRLVDVDNAAILGESLYVCPVLEDDVDEIEIIKPPGIWYRFNTELNYTNIQQLNLVNDVETVPVQLNEIPVYLRGGKIIAFFEDAAKTTIETIYTMPLTLTVALDEEKKASGEVYFDDGTTYNYTRGEYLHRKFIFENGVLKCIKENKEAITPVDVKEIFISRIVIFGAEKGVEFEKGKTTFENGILTIDALALKLDDEWSLKLQ